MEKTSARYSVDANNRLVIKASKVKLVPNGSFSIDAKNNLVYWLNEPLAWRRKYLLPGKIVFAGNWSLNPDHDLALEINRAKDILVLKGEIISAQADKLAFEISSSQDNGLNRLRILELSGAWGSDEANQIFFAVTKGCAQDVLKFIFGWRLNQNQQIEYVYQKIDLKTKTRSSYAFTIKGFWEITSANRLAYIISRSTDSKFDFKVCLETPTVYPKDGEIRYRLGLGIKENRQPKDKILSLYGLWKLNRTLGLEFEMEYGKREKHSLSFGAEINFNKNNQITFNLNDKSGSDLGISVVFTHKFLKQSGAEWFLRLKRSSTETGIDGGLRIPF